jgi:hypothetical protein
MKKNLRVLEDLTFTFVFRVDIHHKLTSLADDQAFFIRSHWIYGILLNSHLARNDVTVVADTRLDWKETSHTHIFKADISGIHHAY